MTSLLAAFAVAAMLAGCGFGVGNDVGAMREQAQAALARWADAVDAAGGPGIVPVGELTGQVGDWESEVGDNNKRALHAGLVVVTGDLPAGVPEDGEVTWPDGSTELVPLLAADAAVRAIQDNPSAPCDDCVAMRISAARLTTGPIETSRGPATGPLWELTLDGTAVKLTHVAIADRVVVVAPAWDPDDPPNGVWLDLAQGAVDSSEVTVSFIGSPNPGDQPCGENYTAEAVESELAVVIIVQRHPNLAPANCLGLGAQRTAVATLAAPLGSRTVLQVYDGTPVRMQLAP